jgi:pyrroloquinoline-quinone synthase
MSSTVSVLQEKIASKHLLKHPFYVAWSNGTLPLENLRHYAEQYFAHVRAFPVYLSTMHSHCTNLDTRQVIAGNLADEEATLPTHPQLWLDFAAGLGLTRESVLSATAGPRMAALVDTFSAVAKMDTGLAVAGLFCYEAQIPAVASAKIAGLKANYGIDAEATLRYFQVHESADVEHSAQWETILRDAEIEPRSAAEVADRTLDALWSALDEVYESRVA